MRFHATHMKANRTDRLAARDGLREALRAHDTAAVTHMRAATKHIREGRTLAARIERLSGARRGQR